MSEIDKIEKRKRIVTTIVEGIESKGVIVIDCFTTHDVYLTIQCAMIAAHQLNRSPFECNFQYIIRRVSREDNREVTGVSITMKSKPEKIELPKQRANAIMELEI